LFLLVINAGDGGVGRLDACPACTWRASGAALWTSILVSLVGTIGSWFVGGKGKFEVYVKRR